MLEDFNTPAEGSIGEQQGTANIPNFRDIDPETATPEQIEQLKNAGQTLLGQLNHWKTVAQKARQNPVTPTPQIHKEVEPELDSRLKKLEVSEQKRMFQHAHNLTPEEADHLFNYAQGANVTPDQALESPFIKTALDAFRNARKNDDATPRPSGRSPVVEGKTFAQMTNDERRANFNKMFSK